MNYVGALSVRRFYLEPCVCHGRNYQTVEHLLEKSRHEVIGPFLERHDHEAGQAGLFLGLTQNYDVLGRALCGVSRSQFTRVQFESLFPPDVVAGLLEYLAKLLMKFGREIEL